jgi:hypothetical protein
MDMTSPSPPWNRQIVREFLGAVGSETTQRGRSPGSGVHPAQTSIIIKA